MSRKQRSAKEKKRAGFENKFVWIYRFRLWAKVRCDLVALNVSTCNLGFARICIEKQWKLLSAQLIPSHLEISKSSRLQCALTVLIIHRWISTSLGDRSQPQKENRKMMIKIYSRFCVAVDGRRFVCVTFSEQTICVITDYQEMTRARSHEQFWCNNEELIELDAGSINSINSWMQ